MIEPEEEMPEFESTQVTNISQAEVKTVHGELVRMHQSDAEFIRAGEAELHQSAAGTVKADQITTRGTLIGMVNAGEFQSEAGATGMVQAGKASISGYTGLVVAGTADIHHAAVGYLAARDVTASEVRTTVLLARSVQGNVTTMLDTRGVVIAGLIGGLFGGLMLLLGRFLLRRN
jgi:hypothetical protein